MLCEKLSGIYYVHLYTLKPNLTLQKYLQIGMSYGQNFLLMILRHRFSIMWHNGFARPLCSVKVLNHLFVQCEFVDGTESNCSATILERINIAQFFTGA